jgi:hypothetical protein
MEKLWFHGIDRNDSATSRPLTRMRMKAPGEYDEIVSSG